MQDVSINSSANDVLKLIETQKLGGHLIKGSLENASLGNATKGAPPTDLPEITGKGEIIDTQA